MLFFLGRDVESRDGLALGEVCRSKMSDRSHNKHATDMRLNTLHRKWAAHVSRWCPLFRMRQLHLRMRRRCGAFCVRHNGSQRSVGFCDMPFMSLTVEGARDTLIE